MQACKTVTPKAYSPLSVAFEHPKSSPPPAHAAPLTAGKAIAANKVALVSHLFISISLRGHGMRARWVPPGIMLPSDHSPLGSWKTQPAPIAMIALTAAATACTVWVIAFTAASISLKTSPRLAWL